MARSRRAASSGRSANQVGKAAIIGWRDVLAPALRGGGSASPFDGSLLSLLVPGNAVIARRTHRSATHGSPRIVSGASATGATGESSGRRFLVGLRAATSCLRITSLEDIQRGFPAWWRGISKQRQAILFSTKPQRAGTQTFCCPPPMQPREGFSEACRRPNQRRTRGFTRYAIRRHAR